MVVVELDVPFLSMFSLINYVVCEVVDRVEVEV